jgi:hypothetical protein
VDIPGLLRIEHGLQKLTPPRWPEELLGTIDRDKAARGEKLFEQYCRECHGPHVAEASRQQASAPLKSTPGVEWRIEVIPLDHIGTDPAAAEGFAERHYDLSATGISPAEMERAFKPLLIRQLARDTRFRLREIIRLRTEQKLQVGELPKALEAYPDPDANPVPSLPEFSFTQIRAALRNVLQPLPAIPGLDAQPEDPLGCALDCHTLNLLWNLEHGAAEIDAHIASLDIKKMNEGVALNLIGILVKNKFYEDYGVDYATQQCLEGFGTLDVPQVIAGYKPRPLEGVWATPPFLHNGSVPSLYQMLLPPAKRDAKFFVGRREFDPAHVGYVTAPAEDDDAGFWLDTSIPGNRNIGHGFEADAPTWQKHKQDPEKNPLPHGVIGPELSEDERLSLVEYLKVHRDPPTPADHQPRQCQLWGQTL